MIITPSTDTWNDGHSNYPAPKCINDLNWPTYLFNTAGPVTLLTNTMVGGDGQIILRVGAGGIVNTLHLKSNLTRCLAVPTYNRIVSIDFVNPGSGDGVTSYVQFAFGISIFNNFPANSDPSGGALGVSLPPPAVPSSTGSGDAVCDLVIFVRNTGGNTYNFTVNYQARPYFPP